MARNQPLEEPDAQVRAALEQWTSQDPPASVEEAAMAAFDRRQRAKRRQWIVPFAAVAAGLVIAWTGARGPRESQPEQAGTLDRPFTALPYVVQPASYESTEIVRATVPVAELIAAGLPLRADPSGQVDADILVGQDGRARAVRLVEFVQ